MRSNIERILSEDNRGKEDKIKKTIKNKESEKSDKATRIYDIQSAPFFLLPEDYSKSEISKSKAKISSLEDEIGILYEELRLIEAIDQEQALALNDEFDRLVENLKGKKGKELQKAKEELEEFKNRLNGIKK